MTTLRKLWIGSFLGTTANFALYLLLASEIFRQTGSALLASLVFAAQWALPVLLVLRIEQAGRMIEPRRLMVGAALTFAGLTAVAAVAAPGVAPVIALCAIFGALESLVKSGRLVALKRYYEPPALQTSVSSLASAMYLGSAAGGALFALAPSENGVAVVAAAAVGAHLVAAAALATLPAPSVAVAEGERGALSARAFAEALRASASDPRVFEALFRLVLVCGVFQGFHNIARTALPLVHLDAGGAAVGVLQVVAAAAIIAGVVTYRFAFAASDRLTGVAGVLGYVCAALLVAPALTRDAALSFSLYFAFIFTFELLFIHHQTRLVVAAKASAISVVSAFQYAVINLAMLTTAVGGGVLVDTIGLVATAAVFALGFAALSACREAIRRGVARGSGAIGPGRP
ncbi:MAG: hypothetical protein MEP57_06935 [Microvirga sp.]|nr:hypothetical protein [Microvirga sp.]